MPASIDLIGQRFCRLLVVGLSDTGINKKMWICKCDCGNERLIPTANLRNGNSKSCGCKNREELKVANTKHGYRRTPEYSCWTDIKTRCYNPNSKYYFNYGGRGIRVCDSWLSSFENFLKDMGHRPSKAHSLDRYPDVNGDYCPSNCRWATWMQQQNNKRSNVYIEHAGCRLTVSEWNKLFGRAHHFLYRKMKLYSFGKIYEMNKHRIKQL